MPTVSATPHVPFGLAPLWLGLALLAACATAPGPGPTAAPTVPPATAPAALAVGVCAPPPEPLPPPAPMAFAWRNPLPQGDSLLSVWGASQTQIWAVGDRGRVLKYDGAAWQVADPGPADYLAGVWGSGPRDVFVTGYNGRVLHFDGSRWWVQPTGVTNDFNGIWGSGPKDVFTVGDRGVILHYDGTCWRRQETGTTDLFFGVWGSGPKDVWAVGGRGNVARYDGSAWAKVDLGELAPDTHFVGVWGPRPGAVYVVGNGGTVLHRHGGVWRREDVDTDVLLRWVGGTGPDDVWVAGDEGVVRHYDGTAWRPVETGPPDTAGDRAIRGGWRGGPGGPTVLVGDEGLLLSSAGGPFGPMRAGATADLYAVDGPWAAGDGGAVLFRDAEDVWHRLSVPVTAPLFALTVLVDGRVLAGGADGVWLGDGHGWRRLARPAGVPDGAVLGLASWGRRAIAVGEHGLVLGFDGDRLVGLRAPGDETLYAVAGTGPERFLVVGEGGAAYRFSPDGWAAGPVADGEDLLGVSAAGVAVGARGGVYRWWDGAWKVLAEPGGFALYAVADDPEGGAWAAGDVGRVLRIAGPEVTEVPVPTGGALHAVAVDPDGRVSVVGDAGAVLEKAPGRAGVKIR